MEELTDGNLFIYEMVALQEGFVLP
jgi:hypothetical protein